MAYTNEEYLAASQYGANRNLIAAQGLSQADIDKMAVGSTFNTTPYGQDVGYTWKVVQKPYGKDIELVTTFAQTYTPPQAPANNFSTSYTWNGQTPSWIQLQNDAMAAGTSTEALTQWYSQAARAWAENNRIAYDAESQPLTLLAMYQNNPTPIQKEYLSFFLDQASKSSSANSKYLAPVLQAWKTGQPAYQVYYNVASGNTPSTTTTPASLIASIEAAPVQNKVAGYTPSGQLENDPSINAPGKVVETPAVTPAPLPMSSPTPTPTTTTPTTSTWGNMDTTPVNTINAQDITWRTLPSELFTFPFWREGMSGSTTTAGSTPGYTMQQPRYSPELFFPAAQQWGNWTPSERQAYQSAVQGTGASWDDVFEGLKKKWGVFTNTVQPTWAHTGGTFNWTPAGYSK